MQILHFYHYCRCRVNTYKYALRNGATEVENQRIGGKKTRISGITSRQVQTFTKLTHFRGQVVASPKLDLKQFWMLPMMRTSAKRIFPVLGSPFVIMFPWNSEFKLQNHQRLSVWGLLIAWPGMRFPHEKWLVVAIFIGAPWAPMSQLMVAIWNNYGCTMFVLYFNPSITPSLQSRTPIFWQHHLLFLREIPSYTLRCHETWLENPPTIFKEVKNIQLDM